MQVHIDQIPGVDERQRMAARDCNQQHRLYIDYGSAVCCPIVWKALAMRIGSEKLLLQKHIHSGKHPLRLCQSFQPARQEQATM
jgi:hypothetical protein